MLGKLVNGVFVSFTITKLKHILAKLLVEYSTFGIYMMFGLINCVIAATILS